MSTDITHYIDAWEQSVRSLAGLCESLPPADWDRPTPCPGWSVRDIVSHVVGFERELLGDPVPIHRLPRDLRHIRNEWGKHAEIAVDVRRCHTPPEMTAELNETIERRIKHLRDSSHRAEDDVRGIAGKTFRYERLLGMQVFNVWAHEQDVRRSVRQPGNLDALAAYVVRDRIVGALPEVIAEDVKAPPRSTIVFDITDPVSFVSTVSVGEDRRGSLDKEPPFAPTVRLAMDWETFVRLACGRVRPEKASVEVEGDEKLARRVIAEMVITP